MPFLPTRRLLWLALGAALPLAAATIWRGFVLAAVVWLVALAVVVALDARGAPAASDFTVERRHDERLSLGEANAVDLSARWSGRGALPGRALPIRVRDETPPEIPNDHTPLAGTVEPGGEWLGRYHLFPRRRGDYRFGAIVLRAPTPRGLLVWQHSFPATRPARVYPNLRAVRRYDLLAKRGRLHEAGLRRSRQFGSGTEFERLRDYLPDDDYRRINWKASARRRQPLTVEYETERSQNLMLLLDAGRLMGAPVGNLRKLDHAVNAALMLAHVAMEMGDRVGLVVFTDNVDAHAPLARGARQFQLILERLYRVEAQPIEADPARALAWTARRQMKRSLIVLFTDLAEAAEPEGLIRHLGLLARRHLPICVMISNPEITRLATAPITDSTTAYEKVVAQQLLDERRSVVERIERQGALVLDVPAEHLTSGVINRYMEIKAKTRL